MTWLLKSLQVFNRNVTICYVVTSRTDIHYSILIETRLRPKAISQSLLHFQPSKVPWTKMFGSEVNSFVRSSSFPLPFSGHNSIADLSIYVWAEKNFCTTIWSKLCYILTKLFGNLLKILKNPFKCTFFLIY